MAGNIGIMDYLIIINKYLSYIYPYFDKKKLLPKGVEKDLILLKSK